MDVPLIGPMNAQDVDTVLAPFRVGVLETVQDGTVLGHWCRPSDPNGEPPVAQALQWAARRGVTARNPSGKGPFMSIRIALNHWTRYRYDRLVALSPHVLRLRPAPHCRTPISAYSLTVQPSNHFINWQQDPFGNYLARLVFQERTRELTVEVDLVANMTVINPFDFFLEEDAETFPFHYEPALARELAPYRRIEADGPRLRDWLRKVPSEPMGTVDFLVAVNRCLREDIDYSIRMEPGVQDCEYTLERAIGSCRDSSWLLVQIFRHLGLAARFVSGYLVQLAPDVRSLDGPAGPEADFTDLHAWTEVYLPGAGWVGLDPTSGLFAGEGHIPLACSPDPVGAAPITGASDPCAVDFAFRNTITRIHEDPRVTKPYREDQWDAINALGRAVDRDLAAQDVRLTLGGEPTFVSIDDVDSAQWNTAALGAHKRQRARELSARLRQRFAPGGLTFDGQGKWYPGEPLPRWALGIFWRADGEPLWRDPSRLADEDVDDGVTAVQARDFMEAVVARLGVHSSHILPAYENALYYLWQEQQQPVNVDLRTTDLDDPRARRQLVNALQRGLDHPVGYCLPLSADPVSEVWQSHPWTLRGERLLLTPGDSPMGLRLPLDSLPWVAREAREPELEEDPMAERGALGNGRARLTPPPPPHGTGSGPPVPLPATQTADWRKVPHTALCIEPRQGRLYVFLPPIRRLEAYVDLVAAIEEAAEALDRPVILEGYEPPADWRLRQLKVTPDPGVIEVNIQPAHTWDEWVHITETLYEEARQARLATEKFMLDGRHTGTGGGNHVTLGGPQPMDSPFLRRPDLLRSLITYWQHHPGLSYLFSGLFVGPTSQAPRVDEARDEGLYELEIAFEQMPAGESSQPWLVDRLLRHLLVDITGNTHRTEFCIDKLYAPDSAAGRQGLVELRAFEMPPHARMSAVQMLLLRALIARFWRQPYTGRLVRWGTALHDRFMLRHFVWADIKEVVGELQAAGYPFQLEWLEPFRAFRFPHLGEVQVGDIHLDLYTAIEPWHVLGEEITHVGTARFVDSSVERLQVQVRGLTESRYLVTCNGRRVPLHATGVHGEAVAGIRYRAWQPPSALHPTIGIHSPLVFDIIDTWNGRSVGGCTYHVAHAGGRGYDVFPVNAYEAETRRNSRFDAFGHTPGAVQPPPAIQRLSEFFPEGHPVGPMAPPPEEINAEYPCTLDLRRARRGW